MQRFCLIAGFAFATAAVASAADDLLIADFEGGTYGEWEVDGEAFGPGPAKGTLPGQMPVSGYRGQRLVNTFFKGDRTTGKLTSPPLKIERDYITFLIGGGGYAGMTCMNLLLEGKVVRTATGPNTKAGGSESLAPGFWDVREFRGKSVSIQIVDEATGGWGHVNVDHIVQSNTKPMLPDLRRRARQFDIANKYLIIPITNGAKTTQITLTVAGKPVRRYDTELATDPEAVDWYAFFTIESYQGKSAQVVADRATEAGFSLIRQSNEIPATKPFYSESLRPQFHFSQKVGWNNDPNGMVYLDGEWHLYFQHNPVGWRWGNMTWGHAVTKDLIHWQQLPNVLFPETMARGACFSGGATIDKKNSAGWKTGDNDVLVAFLTDTGAGESVAYSNDNGRSFTWYDGNPVVKHRGRDPKVIWYAYGEHDEPLDERAKSLGGHWVMVVYDEHPQFKRNIAFYTSTNLKDWTEQSHLPGYFECPELFSLPVQNSRNQERAGDRDQAVPRFRAGSRSAADENADEMRWVVFAADARYAIGKFNGKTFTPLHKGKRQVHYGPYYASQTFENAPARRRIQIGWVRLDMPGMPFNQMFSFPHELTLRNTDEGIRMFAKPVDEINKLHKKKRAAKPQALTAGLPVRLDVAGRLFDIRATFALGNAKRVGLNIGGNTVVYDAAAQKLNGAAMKPIDGCVSIQVMVDRPLLEVCGNEGMVAITAPRRQQGDVDSITAFADGEGAALTRLEVYELESIWKR